MSKHENIYIKHVFDFRITKHINTNRQHPKFRFIFNFNSFSIMFVIKFIFKNTIKYVCLHLLGFFKKRKNIF